MEVITRPDERAEQQAFEGHPQGERLRSMGARFLGKGVQISEETKNSLVADAWRTFIETGKSFCGEVQQANPDQPVLDADTLTSWREDSERLTAAIETLRAAAWEQSYSGAGSSAGAGASH